MKCHEPRPSENKPGTREAVIQVRPRILSEQDAATYLALSVSSFRTVVQPHIRVIRLTQRRKGYLIEDLDKWVDDKAGITRYINPLDALCGITR